jgi:hypothetical protein
MRGCNNGFTPILDLGLCRAAKVALTPTFGGVNTAGFGTEWCAILTEESRV